MSERRVRAIVLAAQRPGVVDPLAQRFGLSHKALVPLCGKPLICHVLRTLLEHERVAEVAVSIEREAFGAVRLALEKASLDPALLLFVPSAPNLADSVFAAARAHDGPLIVTTADNALLLGSSISAMDDAVASADVAIAMSRREAVLESHPEGQRRFYRFRDAEYSNCNLYAMAGQQALCAAEVFRGGGQFAKKVGRVVASFGVFNLVLMCLGALDLSTAMRRISKRIGKTIAPVVLSDGSQAIDVDNDRTYAVVETILSARRQMADVPRSRPGSINDGGRPFRVTAMAKT